MGSTQARERIVRWALGIGLVLALGAGAVLRLVWGADIEYKADEAWTFRRTQEVGRTEPFPGLGNPTSQGYRNPGLSIWIFLALGKLFGATDPVTLARAVQVLNITALLLLVGFIRCFVPRGEREPWLWAAALAAVNPLAVLCQRKIWPPSVLPIFTVVMLAGWYRRDRRWGAFLWGLVGACLGQIHMAGFFLAAGFAVWALLFDRKGVRWVDWLAGSSVGALLLLPWLVTLANAGWGEPRNVGNLAHVFEARFWLYWVTEPTGLSVAYALDKDFGDFLTFPRVAGFPTFLMGLLHAVLIVSAAVLLFRAGRSLWQRRRLSPTGETERPSPTALTLGAAVWGFGVLLTFSTLPIHRHYVWDAFPLTFVWLAWVAFKYAGAAPPDLARSRKLLLTLCVVQGLVTASFLAYIHAHRRPIRGDYATPYAAQSTAQKAAAWDGAANGSMRLPSQ
jgi:hypothetical protein